jgi:hypothetical protein
MRVSTAVEHRPVASTVCADRVANKWAPRLESLADLLLEEGCEWLSLRKNWMIAFRRRQRQRPDGIVVTRVGASGGDSVHHLRECSATPGGESETEV